MVFLLLPFRLTQQYPQKRLTLQKHIFWLCPLCLVRPLAPERVFSIVSQALRCWTSRPVSWYSAPARRSGKLGGRALSQQPTKRVGVPFDVDRPPKRVPLKDMFGSGVWENEQEGTVGAVLGGVTLLGYPALRDQSQGRGKLCTVRKQSLNCMQRKYFCSLVVDLLHGLLRLCLA